MAKRKATARSKKPARKTSRAATRQTSRSRPRASARRAARTRAARPKSRRTTSVSARKQTAPARKAAPKRPVRRPAARPAVRPKPAALNRERRQLREDETVPTPPSTLDYSRRASGAESGHNMYRQRMREHTEGGPALTGGDVDTDWNEAYSSGEETPGGDMPTPDQDVVEEIGRALGVEYEDAEELKGAEKIEDRDRHRWEYDPASAEDYRDRNRRGND